MKRKAFSTFEILIALVIVGILMSIALLNLKPIKDTSRVTTMKSDLNMIENLIVSKYQITEDFSKVFNDGDYTDTNNDGFAEDTLKDGTKIPLSKDNGVSLEAKDCNGDGYNDDGFYIKVWSTTNEVKDKIMEFNSCTNGFQKVQ